MRQLAPHLSLCQGIYLQGSVSCRSTHVTHVVHSRLSASFSVCTVRFHILRIWCIHVCRPVSMSVSCGFTHITHLMNSRLRLGFYISFFESCAYLPPIANICFQGSAYISHIKLGQSPQAWMHDDANKVSRLQYVGQFFFTR